MTHWVGLTGGIGSGKSAAADLFVQLGVTVLDADAISRTLTAIDGAALPAIAIAFGANAILDGQLNRAHMRHLVFTQPSAKAQLEAILHPMVLGVIQEQKQNIRSVYALIDIPLLTELPMFQTLVERVLVIDCPETVQVERVMARSGLSQEQIGAIMLQQATRAQRLALADDVITNDGGYGHLQQQVLRCHQNYQQQFHSV